MVEYLIVIIIVAVSAAYILIRLKNTAKDCESSKCGSCSYYQNCSKEIKKDRP